jgi:hypothetical protein
MSEDKPVRPRDGCLTRYCDNCDRNAECDKAYEEGYKLAQDSLKEFLADLENRGEQR